MFWMNLVATHDLLLLTYYISIYIKRSVAVRLSVNASREQRRNDTKLAQITDAIPGLDLYVMYL